MTDGQPPGIPPRDGHEAVMPTALLAGRYRIERVIGQGAFGRVYLAFDTRLRRNVAVKELLASREQTDRDTYQRYLERFQREARATGTIQHPNVVTVYDLHVDPQGNNYLVMEYVDGTNLRDLLTQVGTLPEARAVAITIDIARALDAVHEQEIVHRDVKPANIMITRRGAAKLMDFGIARIAHEQQLTITTGGHPGTPIYMSPEQSAGYGYIDGRSDLYALGLILYEMFVGEPFARRRRPLGAVRGDLPPQLVAVVDRLTTRDVDARYQNAAEVIRDLQRMAIAAPMRPESYRPPDANPTRVGPPASWPSGAPTGTATGAPATYGGPATPPTAPGSSGFSPPLYPPPPGYAPPPSTIPPRRNRGRIFAIGGAVLAVLAMVGVALLVLNGQSGSTATATPGQAGATATVVTVNVTLGPGATGTAVANTIAAPTGAAATATHVATSVAPTVSPTASPTRAAATPTLAPTAGKTATPSVVAQPTTWTEQNGLLSLKYPSNWKQTRDTSDASNLVELDGPGAVPFIYVFLYDPQQGALQDEIQVIIKNQASGQKFTYTDQKTQDAQIGGQPAKMLTYTYTDKTDPTKTFTGAWWVVNNGGKEFAILASPLGSSRADVDAIVGSITFGNAKTATFTDPDGVIRLQYPTEWALSKDAADTTNLLFLSGANDEIHIFLSVYPASGETYDQALKKIRDTEANDGKTVRTYDPAVDTKVGGAPAKSLAYSYTQKDKPDLQPGIATIWLVDHNGKRYEFRCSNIASHRAEIEAVMGSVTFLK
ncbi:MAG: serine/threonine protein kinase [Thermomicrobiales bacterium]